MKDTKQLIKYFYICNAFSLVLVSTGQTSELGENDQRLFIKSRKTIAGLASPLKLCSKFVPSKLDSAWLHKSWKIA